MLEKVIKEINSQGTELKRFSNEWNVMQQLIDIVSVQPESAEIVYQDLQVDDMKVPKLVKNITSKRIADPEKVMQKICEFYGINCPDVLPPEIWRKSDTDISKPIEKNSITSTEPIINLIDLM
jgi:hypothetical protein